MTDPTKTTVATAQRLLLESAACIGERLEPDDRRDEVTRAARDINQLAKALIWTDDYEVATVLAHLATFLCAVWNERESEPTDQVVI